MDKSYVDKLTVIKESYNSKDFDTLKSELSAYKDIIPDFFSRNGESAGIRSMYEKVNDPMYKDKNIDTIDLNIAESVYDDYLNGMYTFIQDLNTAVITESDVSKYSSKLESAKEKDSIFIESIFGGSLNEKNECTLKEATKDLEILINFIPKIESFYNKSLILSESMNNNNDLVNSSIELVCESVSNYAYNVIKNVMTTYYTITEAFDEGGDLSDNNNDEIFVLL